MSGLAQLLAFTAAVPLAPTTAPAAGQFDGISQILGFTYAGVGLLIFFLSLPLARGKVAPNRWYGVRLPQAYKSDEAWYAINGYGGKCLVGWALSLILGGVIILLFPIAKPGAIVPYMMIMSVLIIVPIALIWNFARKF